MLIRKEYLNRALLAFLGVFFPLMICQASDHMAPGRISDILNTKHNFAANVEPALPDGQIRRVKASIQNETCVFCHTPHGDPIANVKPFLWNTTIGSATYDMYASASSQVIASAPNNSSKMCLSCHDGVIAVGTVDVVNSSTVNDISVTGAGVSASGNIVDTQTGYNSNLGINLTNDHPISIAYTMALATGNAGLEDELRNPEDESYIGVRTGRGVAAWNASAAAAGNTVPSATSTSTSTRIAVPLEASYTNTVLDLAANNSTNLFATPGAGTIECTTCHDPHIRSTDNSENIKFLRLHRFQKSDPGVGNSFDITRDINCIACHNKANWGASSHGNVIVADEVYTDEAATLREFPLGTTVWESSCLGCHDPHTVEGARYLLREATDGAVTAGAKAVGSSSIEESCYQCHSSDSVLVDNSNVADIKLVTDISGGHTLFDFAASASEHNILDSDFTESQANLQTNRHVTCADCHHPHRGIKNTRYDGAGDSALATHDHSGSVIHTNIASGSLRGVFGVEPNYTSVSGVSFNPYVNSTGSVDDFLTFSGAQSSALGEQNIHRGDPDAPSTTDEVTKEYQVCLKCHSNFGIANGELTGNLGTRINVAMEIRPVNDPTTSKAANNHNSWHPVSAGTDADVLRSFRMPLASMESPFNVAGAIGSQTMYCADCHSPENPANAILAKGSHGGATAVNGMVFASGDSLCISCHVADQYKPSVAPSTMSSGFACAVAADCLRADNATPSDYPNNLHVAHALVDGAYSCSQCHVQIPHGWENKALLVNKGTKLTVPSLASGRSYYAADAQLSMDFIAPSGAWTRNGVGAADNCASSGCHTN